jgi:hypothetical protein
VLVEVVENVETDIRRLRPDDHQIESVVDELG